MAEIGVSLIPNSGRGWADSSHHHGFEVLMHGLALILALMTSAIVAEEPVPIGRQVADFQLDDYLGTQHSLAEFKDKQAVVVVFLGVECPLAKLYGPRLAELAAAYKEHGVAFVGIDSNRQDTLAELAHYARKHGIEF